MRPRWRFPPSSPPACRIGLPDADRLIGSLHGSVLAERGSERAWEAGLEQFDGMARRFPEHFYR